jgi:hypothetical protein
MNNWTEITKESDVQDLIEKSVAKPQIIYKHSVTCGVSAYTHQSPQIIVLKDKRVSHTASHHSIEPATIEKYL